MEIKHTPGPWYGRPNHDPVLIQGCEVADLSLAFACGGGDPRRPEYIANARLIAAAPDQNDALMRAPDIMSMEPEAFYLAYRTWWGERNAAIARATGGAE